MATTTFSLRIEHRDHELMTRLAAIRNQSVAELAREMITDGIRRMLDPEEIEKSIAEERKRLLDAAKEIREGSDLPT